MRLGKRLGVVNDPRQLHLRQFLPGGPPVPPARTEIGGTVVDWPMLGNDLYGDCTFAAEGHRIIGQEKAARQHEVQVDDQDVLAGYASLTGFDPQDSSTDHGAYLLDVLNFMRTTGIGREADNTRHTIAAYVKVNHASPFEMKAANWMFGGLIVGVAMPRTAQGQHDWDVDPNGGADAGPGSWGGHAVFSQGYGPRGLRVVSWGEKRIATWEFVARYVDECYAAVSEDWLRPSGQSPHGLDVDALNAALQNLT